MSIATKFLKLVKPEKTDKADVTMTNKNWDVIDELLTPFVATTTDGGSTYEVSAEHITELYDGLEIKIRVDTTNRILCKLNLNNLGAKDIKRYPNNANKDAEFLKGGELITTVCHKLMYSKTHDDWLLVSSPMPSYSWGPQDISVGSPLPDGELYLFYDAEYEE